MRSRRLVSVRRIRKALLHPCELGGQWVDNFTTANAFSRRAVVMEPKLEDQIGHTTIQRRLGTSGHEWKGNRNMSVAIGHAECALEAHDD
jgi:hypothetical protein